MAESFEATGTPESLEDKLTADIVDGDDDNALLDTVLGDVSTNDDQDRELNILDQDEGGGEQAEDPVGISDCFKDGTLMRTRSFRKLKLSGKE